MLLRSGALLALFAAVVPATEISARLAQRGFVRLTDTGGAPPPQATVGGTTRDTFRLPMDGPSLVLDASPDGTVTLPQEAIPAPPSASLGWRVQTQFEVDGPQERKRTGYDLISPGEHIFPKQLQPPGKHSSRVRVTLREAVSARQEHRIKLTSLPPGARLSVACALLDDWRVEGDCGAWFSIYAVCDGNPPLLLHREEITVRGQTNARTPWREIDLSLDQFAGKDLTLLLETQDAPTTCVPNLAPPLWGDPVIYLPAPPAAPPGASVVLVSLDTVRADRLGCYGYPRPTSPRLDALAAESYLFENCLTPAPMTTPAHASALIGVSPYLHRAGVFAEGFRLTPQWPSLAELLSARGYRTAAFTEGVALAGSIGFSRGFHSYSDGPSPESHKRDIIGTTFASAAGWLGRFGHLPSLLFVHTYHAHDPYTAPAEVLAKFTDPAYTGKPCPDPKLAKTPEEKRNASDHYDAGIAHTDSEFGKFLDTLAAQGQLDDRWLIVFSDHGEEFWEHGGTGHARALYRESVHVPLIVRPPGGLAGGQCVAAPVLLTDIFATVLARTATPLPAGRDSLDVLSVGEGRPLRMGFYRGYEFPKDQQTQTKEWETFSLRTPAYTFITTANPPNAAPTEEIFAVEDTAEAKDLTKERSADLGAARTALQESRAQEDQARPAKPDAAPLSTNELEALQGLGYF